MSVDLDHRVSGGPQLPDRPWVPTVAAFLLASMFLLALLVRAGGDPSMLVHAGPPWTRAAEAPDSLTVQEADRAFDGQFFYRLGVDPWSTDETVAGVEFDLPALRNARWGYGALAWVGSAGRTSLVPWSLITVNLAAATALGAVGGAFARSVGRHRAWGFLFVLWPGFAYSLSLDTSELLASTLVLGGLVASRARRPVRTALLLTLAVLVRDTAAIVPFGFVLAAAVTGIRSSGSIRHRIGTVREPLLAGAPPLIVLVLWQLLQRIRFGELPVTSSGDNNLAAPLVGFLRLLGDAASSPGGETLFRAGFGIAVLALVAAAAVALRSTQVDAPVRGAWITAVGVTVLLNAYLWSGATAFMRATTEAGILSIAILLATPRTRIAIRPALAIALATGWTVTAAVQLVKLG